jgi:hypothetical protein
MLIKPLIPLISADNIAAKSKKVHVQLVESELQNLKPSGKKK